VGKKKIQWKGTVARTRKDRGPEPGNRTLVCLKKQEGFPKRIPPRVTWWTTIQRPKDTKGPRRSEKGLGRDAGAEIVQRDCRAGKKGYLTRPTRGGGVERLTKKKRFFQGKGEGGEICHGIDLGGGKRKF